LGESKQKPVSIVIPSWNGRELLERFLPSVLRALHAYPKGGEVLVVDDGSSDGTVEFLGRHFPAVRTISLSFNEGFAAAANRGFMEAAFDIVVLLNNDVEVKADFLTPLVRPLLEDDGVFASCARSLDWDKKTFRDGGKIGQWKRGFWRVWKNYDTPPGAERGSDPLLSFYCPGSFSAFNRKKWLQLGGLDGLFKPFNWEDTDICYRALKRGWRLVYEPRSVVYHRPNTTISGGAFRKNYIRYVSRRNRLFFHWKNLTDKEFLRSHILFLILSIPLSILRLDLVSAAAVFGACRNLSQIRKRREVEKASSLVKDIEIKNNYNNFMNSAAIVVK